MYGVILMAKSENLLRAPPENRSRNPKRFPDEKRLSKIDVSTPGTGICTPRRNTKNITIVKRMRSFNSLLAAKFAKADPISDHLYFSTCCFNFLLCGLGESLRSYIKSLGQFSIAQNTDAIENIFKNTGMPAIHITVSTTACIQLKSMP